MGFSGIPPSNPILCTCDPLGALTRTWGLLVFIGVWEIAATWMGKVLAQFAYLLGGECEDGVFIMDSKYLLDCDVTTAVEMGAFSIIIPADEAITGCRERCSFSNFGGHVARDIPYMMSVGSKHFDCFRIVNVIGLSFKDTLQYVRDSTYQQSRIGKYRVCLYAATH